MPVAYGAGAKLISRRAGLIAAALTACSPLLIWYSQEARSYEMLVFLSSLSLLAFAYVLATPTPRSLTAWVVASALALATHYYAVLAVVPEAVLLLWMHRSRRAVQVAVGLVGLCGLALIPLAISQTGTGNANWIGVAPVSRRLGQVVPQFAVGFDGPAHSVLEPVAIAVLVLAAGLVFFRSDGSARRGALIAGGIALAGLVLNLLLVAAGVDDLITRNVLAIWMAAALFVAGGLAAARAQRVGLAAACVSVRDRGGHRFGRGLRPRARAAGLARGGAGARRAAGCGAARAGNRAILVQHYRDLLPLSLYMPGLACHGPVPAPSVSELDVVSFTVPASRRLLLVGVGVQPVAVADAVELPRSPASAVVSERHELQFTVLRMVASHPVRVTPAEVSRALTATRLADDRLLIQR